MTTSPQRWLYEAELSRLGKKGLKSKKESAHVRACGCAREREREREQPVHDKQMMFCSTAAKVGGGWQPDQTFLSFFFSVQQMKQKEEEKRNILTQEKKTDH